MSRKINDYFNSFSKFFCCFIISTALGTGFYYTTAYFTNTPSQNISTTTSFRTTLSTFQQPIVTTIPTQPIVTTVQQTTKPIVTTIPVQQTTKPVITTVIQPTSSILP